MTRSKQINIAASVYDRLLNQSRSSGRTFSQLPPAEAGGFRRPNPMNLLLTKKECGRHSKPEPNICSQLVNNRSSNSCLFASRAWHTRYSRQDMETRRKLAMIKLGIGFDQKSREAPGFFCLKPQPPVIYGWRLGIRRGPLLRRVRRSIHAMNGIYATCGKPPGGGEQFGQQLLVCR